MGTRPPSFGSNMGVPTPPASIDWDDAGRALAGLAGLAGLSILNWLLWWVDADIEALGMLISFGQFALCSWLAVTMFRKGANTTNDAVRVAAPIAAMSSGVRALVPVGFYLMSLGNPPELVVTAANWATRLVLLGFFVGCYAAFIAQSQWRNQWALHAALLALLLVLLVLPTLSRVLFKLSAGFFANVVLQSAWIALDGALLTAWYLSKYAPLRPAHAQHAQHKGHSPYG